MSAAESRPRLRVAIAGVGPKGLYALERLLTRAAGLPTAAIELDLFEPHHAPGAGPVYDPRQPSYLRMNFAASQIDVRPAGSPAGPAWLRSFTDWRDDEGGGADSYPPRAQVGRYLTEAASRLLDEAPGSVVIRHLDHPVQSIAAAPGGWHVSGDASRSYDEVLVAVGHAGGWDGGLDAQPWIHSAALIDGVFPIERLNPDAVAPGSAVAIRGLALTMIDAVLALTEGRDGRFEPADRPGRLHYAPGAADVAVIVPYSRSGRPMLAKPEPGRVADRSYDDARRRIAALGPGLAVADLIPIIVVAAGPSVDPDRAGRWLRGAIDGAAPGTDLSARDELERSLDFALGAREPDLESTLGATWRGLYPALVERLGGDGLDQAEWPAFLHLARAMERIAFGPPPVNAAKLLALVDAGVVDLGLGAGGLAEAGNTTGALRLRRTQGRRDRRRGPPRSRCRRGAPSAARGSASRRPRARCRRTPRARADRRWRLRRLFRSAERGARGNRAPDGGLGDRQRHTQPRPAPRP